MGRLKLIIPPFVTEYHFFPYLFNKLLHLILFCTFEASNIAKKSIIYIHKTIYETITSTPNIISNWINKPRLHYVKKRCITNHGSGKFSQYLCASKNLWYNEHNCESGQHDRRHTFMHHKCQEKFTPTNDSNPDLKIKSRKKGVTKSPPLGRWDQILCAILCCKKYRDRKTINIFCPIMRPIYVIITYPRSMAETTIFVSTFLDTVFLDVFFWILIRSMMWIYGRRLYDQLKNQEV